MDRERDAEFDAALNASAGAQRIEILDRDVDPADLLFALDATRYERQLDEWKGQCLNKLLGADEPDKAVFQRNKQRFDHLLKLAPRGRIIPFVGAGLSAAYGYPTWRGFLLSSAAEHGDAFSDDVTALLDAGDFEAAAEKVFKKFGPPGFSELFDRHFGDRNIILGPARHVTKIAAGCIITTNFDRMLENVVGKYEPYLGRQANQFHRALADGERGLLKLHGDLRTLPSRVLTLQEYDDAYGPRGSISFKLPVPDALYRVFAHYRLLFLGCSLADDRTMQVLEHLVARDGEAAFPRHFAIAEAPLDASEMKTREAFLNNRMIFPIWYPNGKYAHVDALLKCLAEQC